MELNRKKLVLVSTIFVAVIVLWFLYTIYSSYHRLHITTTSNTLVRVYEASRGDGSTELSYDPDSLVGEATGSKDFRLRDGRYIVVVPKQQDYKELRKAILIKGQDKTLKLEPEFSDEKLNKLLTPDELAKITATLSAKYPRIRLYSISPGKLYKQGQWYATTLLYKDQSDIFNSDTLRVILHKKDSVWNIVTDPPEIIISKVVYPDIPGDIVDDINDR